VDEPRRLRRDTLGNHNFDAGLARLQRQIDAAEFSYVSANLQNVEDNLDGVAPFVIKEVAGVRVAIIGVTNPEAPTLVTPGNFGTIEVTDPVAAAMAARKAARKAGADVFVAVAHLGVERIDPVTGEASGPLLDFARGVKGFDLIFGDHTNVQYSAVINGALVSENLSRGATYSRTTLTVDPRKGRVLDSRIEFVTPVASAVTPDPEVVAMLAPYREQLAAEARRRHRHGDRRPAARRQRRAAAGGRDRQPHDRRDARGVRHADRVHQRRRASLVAAVELRAGRHDAAAARTRLRGGTAVRRRARRRLHDAPFGNEVVTRTVTGAQLWDVMEHSVAALPAANGRFLQISGFRAVVDVDQPAGSRIVSLTLDDGTPIPDDPAFTLTAATNNFTNAGGDGYTMLADGQGTTRELMATVVADYIARVGTIANTVEGRIVIG
jgi:5'-nucleotidase